MTWGDATCHHDALGHCHDVAGRPFIWMTTSQNVSLGVWRMHAGSWACCDLAKPCLPCSLLFPFLQLTEPLMLSSKFRIGQVKSSGTHVTLLTRQTQCIHENAISISRCGPSMVK